MSDVVVLSGAPGVGKSTVARLLALRHDPSVVLHTDDFWDAIAVGAVPPWLPEADAQNQVVVGVAARAAAGYAAGGFTTVVDGVVGPWMLRHYREAVAAAPGVRLHYVVLHAARDVVVARAVARGAGALVDPEPVGRLWDQLADLGDLAHHALRTDSLDVAATVSAVTAFVASGQALLA